MQKFKKIKLIEFEEIEDLNDFSPLVPKNINLLSFNERGKEIQNDSLNKDGSVAYSWFTIYDENGLQLERYNNSHSRYQLNYDENNNLISEIFLSDGSEQFRKEFNYDIENRLLSEYYKNGSAFTKTLYEYDSQGNLRQKLLKPYNGICTTESHFKNGLLTRINHYDQDYGKSTGSTSYEYDDFGNTIEIRKFFSPSEMTHIEIYEYKYDHNNNWTQRIHIKNSGWKIVTKREIEYFQ
ncbi:hypothetical protein [Christiangramia crocea]|uniref:RHS repeat protein n=1 Tax=Christiangramia crocea TaxID=2904124 RepID=A0A9X2A744_9FLAO|nr:hypothetical protein [Gramella crocea]MCG9971162.1 hypothetical protein [Gramella crocea]